MVGQVVENGAPAPTPVPQTLGFTVSHQKVFLDLNLRSRKLKGKTEITINPLQADLKFVKLNCRQAHITKLSISGRAASGMTHVDPYKFLPLPWRTDVHQYHMLQERLEGSSKDPPEPELTITLPKSVKITEIDASAVLDSTGKPTRDSKEADLTQSTKSMVENTARFSPVTLSIEFAIDNIRDGLTFSGWEEGDLTYPHAYTSKTSPYSSCCLFPCVDAIDARCTWELSIRTPRTLGDAFAPNPETAGSNNALVNGVNSALGSETNFSNEDKALDLTVVASGDVTDEIVDPTNPSKKTTSFLCASTVSAQHIGFAVGPFEHVNLAAFRESDDDDKLGGGAISLHGFCLPGRTDELTNTCLPMAKAMDFFVNTYGRYPYSTYKLCFVDDMVHDRVDIATLSIHSNRMLFPEDILDPLHEVTRDIIYGLACQWCGIDIIPKEPSDIWAVTGIAYYITYYFLKKLMGNNEYRFWQAKASERVCEMDVSRPSIYDSGRYVSLDPSHMKLIALKSPLVLFILDRRLTKASGSTGLSRIISRVFLNANVGEITNGALSTQYFIRWCERLGHTKLEVFFNQWVFGAGCPHFRVTQRFNKKRLVVEMSIAQVQSESSADQDMLNSSTFLRDVKEDAKEVYAGGLQRAFTGPMTIRIHEADGTPYEHIVEVKDAITRVDIPYSTKYKRLKRTRKHREKVASGLVAADPSAEGGEEALLYCLGDILQGPEEEEEWKLRMWSKEEEEAMSSESYEWIRMDADFEWICQLQINLPGYMFISQLQQDRDVSAQYDTIRFLRDQRANDLVSSFLVKTVMDKRYFHGIRTAAAAALANHAKEEVQFIGLVHLKKAFGSLFDSESGSAASNDFTDRTNYYVQCAIVEAISNIRDGAKRSPFEAREFLLNKLRENDNSNNDFSDCYYVALLMRGLAEAQASAPLRELEDIFMDLGEGDDYKFREKCMKEIDRHRRIDEWIPSYHNVVSVAALDCKRILAQVGGMSKKAVDYLHYTQDGTHDDLRIAAFSNLVSLDFLKEDHILKWFLYVLSRDPSAYVRKHLQNLFGVFLGKVAIGSDEPAGGTQTTIQQSGNLIIEQESTTETRAADLARKQTIPGALAALKPELNDNTALKTALWEAINSPRLTVAEVNSLLEICDLLYEPVTSMVLTLSYPRYYSATNLGYIPAGGGKKAQQIVAFRRTNRVRTKLMDKEKKLKLPPPGAVGPAGLFRRESSGPGSAVRKPSLSLKPPKKPSFSLGGMPPPNTPFSAGGAGSPGSTAGTPGPDGKPKVMLKLKINPQTPKSE